jgi:hypothetical protein
MKLINICILVLGLFQMSAKSIAQEQNKIVDNPSVIHIVLFKFSGQAKPIQIEQLMSEIKELKGKIKGIQAISSGLNFSERSKGYTHAVSITFTNSEALEMFITNPFHQQLIKDFIKPILADMIVLDYVDNANL